MNRIFTWVNKWISSLPESGENKSHLYLSKERGESRLYLVRGLKGEFEYQFYLYLSHERVNLVLIWIWSEWSRFYLSKERVNIVFTWIRRERISSCASWALLSSGTTRRETTSHINSVIDGHAGWRGWCGLGNHKEITLFDLLICIDAHF